MEWWILIAVASFGLILGSFLNAFLYRYNTGRSVVSGRSQCMHCGHLLGALDLIPVLSYLWLRGKCRYCHSRISPQYPLVEAAAAILAILVYMRTPEPAVFSLAFALSFSFFLTLLFIVVYDLRHQIIPWGSSGIVAGLALLQVLLTEPSFFAFAAGPLLAAPLLIVSLVSKGRWMGWGDGVLELGLGWFLGLTAGLTAFVLAFWSGALVGIILAAVSKRYTMSSEVPFAPFLVFGAACAYFLHVDIFQSLPALFF